MTGTRCSNCNRSLQGVYCSNCGQKDLESLKFRYLFKEFVDHNLDIDSKLFITLKYLITKPWFLTVEYWKGKRARYTSPFKTYLLISFIYFLLVSISTEPENIREDFKSSAKKDDSSIELEQSIDRVFSSPDNEKMGELLIILPLFTIAFFLANRKKKSLFLSHHLIAAVNLNSAFFIIDTFTHAIALIFSWSKYVYLIDNLSYLLYFFYLTKTMNAVYNKSIFWSILFLICLLLSLAVITLILFSMYYKWPL
tara:strand:- start:189 stop:947 length:759 start_codon:yes stop_codon:yes gene_type:complete